MLPERDLGYLEDVRKYAARAIAHASRATYQQFGQDQALSDAVIRCLTVIGEAAARLSEAARLELPQFDWRAMKGMRHVLVHEYGRIDPAKVWEVVTNDLPKLRDALEAYLCDIE